MNKPIQFSIWPPEPSARRRKYEVLLWDPTLSKCRVLQRGIETYQDAEIAMHKWIKREADEA